MINIDELRQRVEAAEQRFGMIDSSQRRYSERLIGMMNAVEEDLAQKQVQFEENRSKILAITEENQQLRGMLHSLLLAIEAASTDQTAEVMRQIDGKLAAMVETKVPAAGDSPPAVAAEAPAVAPEPVAEIAETAAENAPPEPPGVLPTAVSEPAPAAEAAEESAVETAAGDEGTAAPDGASGVREILQRMTQEAAQQGSATAGQS